MERLTRRMCGGWGVVPGYELDTLRGARKVVGRLAAYEDTGLTPEEVAELAQAKQEGRLVVLPCKMGDTVWYIAPTSEICEAEVTGIWLNVYTNPQMWLEIKYYSKITGEHEYKSRIDLMLGKTVFLTHEEAEAALEARKGDPHEADPV